MAVRVSPREGEEEGGNGGEVAAMGEGIGERTWEFLHKNVLKVKVIELKSFKKIRIFFIFP